MASLTSLRVNSSPKMYRKLERENFATLLIKNSLNEKRSTGFGKGISSPEMKRYTKNIVDVETRLDD